MSTSIIFTGTGFYVASADQVTFGTVTVRYNNAPKVVSALNADDALNPSNYSLSGPGPYAIVSIQPVFSDPLAVNIVLSAALAVGTWTVNVANVLSTGGDTLVSPTSAQFAVTTASSLTPLAGGAENDDAAKIIRKHLSPALKGPNWDALIAALSTGDDTNWINAQLAFNQLFLATSSGAYLARRGSDVGIVKPHNVGLSDELFRQLAIKTSTGKVVHQSIREILEIFYGRDSLRAYAETEIDEKFNLTGSLDLSWLLDERESFTYTFQNSEFGSPTAAKAIEVAAALTKTMRDLGSRGFAMAMLSPTTGRYRVRIYSGSLGLGSTVKVTGGTAQPVLKFPAELDVYSGTVVLATGYNWVYSEPDADTTRVSLTIDTSTQSTFIDLSKVVAGDFVVIGTDAQIGTVTSHAIKAVSVTWSGLNLIQSFDIDQITFSGTGDQLSNSAYTFFRPIKKGINTTSGRTVVVAQTEPGQINISIPATSGAVARTVNHAAYLKAQDDLAVIYVKRQPTGAVTIKTSAAHGLTSGDIGRHIQLSNISPATSTPYVTPGNGATLGSTFTYPASQVSLSALTQVPAQSTENGTATVLLNGQILFAGGYQLSGGVVTVRAYCSRYSGLGTSTIIDGTEADGANRHSHDWVTTAPLNGTRHNHAASTYGDGAMVTGGLSGSPQVPLTTVESFSLAAGTWTTLAPMASARSGHSQLELNSGAIMVFGGANTNSKALNSTEIFTSGWAAGASMNEVRTDAQVVKLSNGNVLAIGGRLLARVAPLDDNCLALWHLDETSGTNSADATANSYDLTMTAGAIPAAGGKIDYCVDFATAPGSYSEASGDVTAINALKGEWTLECWVKRNTVTSANFVTFGAPAATEAPENNILLKLGVSTDSLFWKWESGSGVDVTGTMAVPLASVPGYRAGEFNHFALRKTFAGMTYTGKVSGWALGDLVRGQTSGALAEVTGGSIPGGASGFIFAISKNHLNFTTGENLVIIPKNNLTVNPALLTTAAVAGVPLYDVDIFVNGIKQETWGAQQNSTDGGDGWWYLAHDPKDAGTAFAGYLDDVRVSKVSRTDAEIAQVFLQGWGNHVGNLETVGELTPGVELYNGSTWVQQPQMALARAYHRAIVLPGDYVLVTGGLGYDPTQLRLSTGTDNRYWPSQALAQAEIRDPVTGQWSFVESAGVARYGHVATYFATTNSVLLQGGATTGSGDMTIVESLDLNTRTWKTAPTRAIYSRFPVVGARGNLEAVVMGGDTGGNTYTTPEAYLPEGTEVSSGGLNSEFIITAVPDTTTLSGTFTSVAAQKQYTSTMGAKYQGNGNTTGGYWNISTGVRTSNVTTLTLSFPTGIVSSGIAVGDRVYVNSRTSAFGAGLKLVTAATATTISYAETASNQTSISVIGSVSQNYAPEAALLRVSAVAGVAENPGPYIYDPVLGLAITGEPAITVTAIAKNNQYAEIVVTNGTDFSAEGGYLVLGFGYSTQTQPIKYLRTYQSGGNTVLVLDYSYRFLNDFPVGSAVIRLAQREPFNPNPAIGGFWLTDSPAGRIAAESSVLAALAGGINPNISIVYPGGIGLGAYGYPTHGANKLSDVVRIWGGDDESVEVAKRQEE